MKSVLPIWLVLFGLLLQPMAWALPTERADQAERLAHEVAHAIDHGHHLHDGRGHEVDTTLLIGDAAVDGPHGAHHAHAADGVQTHGLPVAVGFFGANTLAGAVPAWRDVQLLSADPDNLLRPPKATA